MSAAGNAGTECRESAGECDVAEICDGIITSCPADGFVATGESCGDISGQCILADACDGVGICTDSGFVEDGTACDDGNVITVNDRCQAGICEGALPTIPTASFSGRTALVLWLLVSGMIVVGYRSRER